MTEVTPVPGENSDAGQMNMITRRRLLKQAGAAGVALTALYAAPSFSSFGPKQAYASITGTGGTPNTTCSVCDILGKPRIVTMVYTGLAGNGFNHQNSSDKPPTITTFVPDITVYPTVLIKWVEKSGPSDYGETYHEAFVNTGGPFVIDAIDLPPGKSGDPKTKLKGDTRLLICDLDENPLQFIKFHTSCSVPIFPDDRFGTMRLTTVVDENLDSSDDIDCPEPGPEPDPSDDFCSGSEHIESLTLKYTGHDDSVLTQDQLGRAEVNDAPGGPPNNADPVWIIMSEQSTPAGSTYIFFNDSVDLGESFVINPGGAVRSELKADSYINIYSGDPTGSGVLLQTIKMHTSCSKPLGVGDQFGAITVEPGFVLV